MSTSITSLPGIRATGGGAPKNPRRRGTVTLALAPLLAALSALLLLVALAGPAALQQPSVTRLVSNTGQTAGTAMFSTDTAQAFTTGSHAPGYTLTRVDMRMSNSGSSQPSYTVSVHEDSSGAPGNSLGTLKNPTLPSTAGLVEFSASGGIDLAASSTYWVVVDISHVEVAVKIGTTTSDSEDSGGQANWSIGDDRRWRGLIQTTWGTGTQPESLQIAIAGYAKGGAGTRSSQRFSGQAGISMVGPGGQAAPPGHVWRSSVVASVKIDSAGWSRFERRFGDNCWDEMAAAVAAAEESSGRTPEDEALGQCQRFLAEDIGPATTEMRLETRLEPMGAAG